MYVLLLLVYSVVYVTGEAAVHTVYSCRAPLRLECPVRSTVAVVRANYGRFSVSLCNPGGDTALDTHCTSATTVNIIQNMYVNSRVDRTLFSIILLNSH